MNIVWLFDGEQGLATLVYVTVAIGATLLAYTLPKTERGKITTGLLVTTLACLLPLRNVYRMVEDHMTAEANRERLAAASALFKERCKTAGEKIVYGADGVEGFLMMNTPPLQSTQEHPTRRTPLYGWERGGDEYIKSYLAGQWRLCAGIECPSHRRAFSYVEMELDGEIQIIATVSRATGKPLHYTEVAPVDLVRRWSAVRYSRYAVQWEDITSVEDRRLGIAGSRINVFDMERLNLMASRTAYHQLPLRIRPDDPNIDENWMQLRTASCPDMRGHNAIFVRKVLKP